MKKIPTLFKRTFNNHNVVNILNEVHPGMEWVLQGEGRATAKIDGSCCAIIDGVFYKRYDARNGKKPPEGAIPCCDPDPITGHHPHWVKVDPDNPADKWFIEAYRNTIPEPLLDGTYEAIGPHFQGNPHRMKYDHLVRHGYQCVLVERSFEGIRDYLRTHPIEGLVFWLGREPMCKIKRSDFGFSWPVREVGRTARGGDA